MGMSPLHGGRTVLPLKKADIMDRKFMPRISPEEELENQRLAFEYERNRQRHHFRAQTITWGVAIAISLMLAVIMYLGSSDFAPALMYFVVFTFVIATIPALIISRVFQK